MLLLAVSIGAETVNRIAHERLPLAADSVRWKLFKQDGTLSYASPTATGLADSDSLTNDTIMFFTYDADDDDPFELKYQIWYTGFDNSITYTDQLPPNPDTLFAQVTGIGFGSDTLRITVVDTSAATDTAVINAYVVAMGPTGATAADGFTGDNGWVDFLLQAGVVYSVTARGHGSHAFGAAATSFTNTSGFNATTDTLKGWGLGVATAVSAKTAAVTVEMVDNAGNPEENVWVTAYLNRSNVTDSAGHGIVNSVQRVKTNASGIAVFQCFWSSYLIPATKWRFSAHTPKSGGMRVYYTVPRSSSVTIDLAD